MAGPTVDNATGLKLVWATSSWVPEYTQINWNDKTRRSVIEVTTLSDVTRKYIPGDCPDPGTLDLIVHWNPENPPPFTATAETLTLFYPTSGTFTTTATTGTAHVAFEQVSGFCTGFNQTGQLEEKMTATITVKLSGGITKVNAGV